MAADVLRVSYKATEEVSISEMTVLLRRIGRLVSLVKKNGALHAHLFRPFPDESSLAMDIRGLGKPVRAYDAWRDPEEETRAFTYGERMQAGIYTEKGLFMPFSQSLLSIQSVLFVIDTKLRLIGLKYIEGDKQYKIQIKFKDVVAIHLSSTRVYIQLSYCPKYFCLQENAEDRQEAPVWFANDLKPGKAWKQISSPIAQGKDQLEVFTGRIIVFSVEMAVSETVAGLIKGCGLRVETESIRNIPYYEPIITSFHLQSAVLDFEIKYLVLCLFSLCYTTCFHLRYRFLVLLQTKDTIKTKIALKRILQLRRPFETELIPIDRKFELIYAEIRGLPAAPQAMVPRIMVTPSTVYFTVPEHQVPNRVTRQFKEQIGSFLRVTFVTEHLSALIGPSEFELNRIRREFLPHFHLLDRTYELLAFSSSQLRERSLWMIASSAVITREAVVNWMGDFSAIHQPAKCASRMGLCLTNTENRVIVQEDELQLIPEVQRNEYVFSDGAGTISQELFNAVKANTKTELDGCALQIRIRGIKGVVNLDPRLQGKRLCYRPSMEKFPSRHLELEILNVACYRPGYLNRQFIILLSTLGIPDQVFLNLQHQAILSCKSLKTSKEELKKRALYASKAEFASPIWQTIVKLLEVASHSYNQVNDPFLQAVASALFTVAKTDIHERQRIHVEKSALLIGVLDEYNVLGPDEVYVNIWKPDTGPEEVTGPVAICKNPCFHPGDFRKLTAVRRRHGLEHYRNVLVFPQKGSRPHPNEITGSDLDGDLFFVTWDSDLTDFQQRTPMNFLSEKIPDKEVTLLAISEFFLQYMTSDVLGRVANTHLALATMSPEKADNKRCLDLAHLHSIAVDFAKTGEKVEPSSIPPVTDWPDFMKVKHYPSWDSSSTAIGKLWRDSENIEAGEDYQDFCDLPEYSGELEEVRRLLVEYREEIEGVMNIYGIGSEVEVITGEIVNFAKHFKNQNKYKRREETRHKLTLIVKELKKRFEGRLQRLNGVSLAVACLRMGYEEQLYGFPWLVAGDQLLALLGKS